MLQYLVILLDDIATSYCYFENSKTKSQLMSIENLRAGILFGMKENLMINIVYPNYDLPQGYSDVIDTIDHCNIMPVAREDADVIVINNWKEMADCSFRVRKNYVLRISKLDLFEKRVLIKELLGKVARLNVVITDIESFSNADFDTYKTCLDEWSHELVRLCALGSSPPI